MSLAVLLLAAAAPSTAVDAERAFAAMAQTEGQWTAFRAFAAPDATMFVPEPANAQQWLKDRADPPQSVMWWPAQAFVSCDGAVTVTRGPWLRGGGRLAGYFTTVWVRQPGGGWKWVLDQGDALGMPIAAAETPAVERADCGAADAFPPSERGGASPDVSLVWEWTADGDGAHALTVRLWAGAGYRTVVSNRIASSE